MGQPGYEDTDEPTVGDGVWSNRPPRFRNVRATGEDVAQNKGVCRQDTARLQGENTEGTRHAEREQPLPSEKTINSGASGCKVLRSSLFYSFLEV